MTWLIAHAAVVEATARPDGRPRHARSWLRCGRCGLRMGAGEPYALVTAAALPRCADCVRAVCGVEPPAAIWAATPATDRLPPAVQAFLDAHGRAASGKEHPLS